MKSIRIFLAALALLIPAVASAQAYQAGAPVSDTNPQPRKDMCWNGTAYAACRSASGATGQVSVTTSATLVAAARTGRAEIVLSVGAANTCAFGFTNAVTAGTGLALAPVVGASVSLRTGASIYGICSSATTVSYAELY